MRRMVKSVLFSVILFVAAVPALAVEGSSGLKNKMKQVMQQHPELMQEMMTNPNHRLAMGYRNNLLNFGKVVKNAASSSETIPGSFLRTAAGEMRRSVDLLEKQHDEVLRNVSAEKKEVLGDIPQLMREHLADVRKRLDHLDELAKGDQIASKEVLKDLDFVMEHCQMAMKGMHGEAGMGSHHGMMKGGNGHDAEMEELVRQMNQAPDKEKVGLMGQIITRIVEQQREMRVPAQEMPYGMHPMMHQQVNPKSYHPEMMDEDPDMDMDEEMDEVE